MDLPLLSQIFAIINASVLPFIYLFYPETKGLSLEAVDHVFRKTGPVIGPISTEDGLVENEVKPELYAEDGPKKRLS